MTTTLNAGSAAGIDLAALTAIQDRLALAYRLCLSLAPKQAVGELLETATNMPEWETVRAALARATPQPSADRAPLFSHIEIAALRRLIECAEELDKRPRPMCRDCADEDGTCPNSKLECNMCKLFADAKALHNKLAVSGADRAPADGAGVPPGFALVPLVPTREMQNAYFKVIDKNMGKVQTSPHFGRWDNMREAYKAMIAATPTAVDSATPQPAVSGEQVFNAWRATQPDPHNIPTWSTLAESTRAYWNKEAIYGATPQHSVDEQAKWLPTADNVNALPEPVRRFVHDLATRCDPAGDTAALTGLRDQLDGVQIMYRKAMAALDEVRGCFNAAEVEGLTEVLANTADERLKDLVERRLMYALYAAQDPSTQPFASTAATQPEQAPRDVTMGEAFAAVGGWMNGGETGYPSFGSMDALWNYTVRMIRSYVANSEHRAALALPASTAASEQQAEADERRKFEAWIKARPGYPFAGAFANLMWDAWQARAALSHRATTAADQQITANSVEWVVNDLAELGVKIGNRFFFLYKGDSLQYEAGMHDDGTPIRWRPVGKREFGECCYPVKFYKEGALLPRRYTDELVYTPGLSFGRPGDADWRNLPPAADQQDAAQAQAGDDAREVDESGCCLICLGFGEVGGGTCTACAERAAMAAQATSGGENG